LHSSNGTQVNGVKIEGAQLLEHGDVIALGDQALVYHTVREHGQAAFPPRREERETVLGRLAFWGPSAAAWQGSPVTTEPSADS
jgi:pSer/pThr/pTyr-binding forkhead associated (FHA) protein